ncbi:hypothetical protein HYT57_04075 [Candidatus Woesearchaeota archaeon]|nr:hypothetical protein [Candidatus Woesearchaeota archaeon]
MKKILLIGFILLVSIGFVFAHGNFDETKQLIDSNISCNELSNEQFEEIGDYYMEQMHPGESHELMHKMMGSEDSITVKQMHIQMAKSIYCGETNQGMMSMMNMMGSGGMMNMMGGNMMSYGMMGNYGYWNFLSILYTALVIGLVILVYLWIIKIWKSMEGKKRR